MILDQVYLKTKGRFSKDTQSYTAYCDKHFTLIHAHDLVSMHKTLLELECVLVVITFCVPNPQPGDDFLRDPTCTPKADFCLEVIGPGENSP